METRRTDYLVIGSGIAGLMAALKLAEQGKVILATKTGGGSSNTKWAQGGISCVVGPYDSFEEHVDDTAVAGANLCDLAAVREVVEMGPQAIDELVRYGVQFSPRNDGKEGYDLGKEGGHSHRRILHAGDITGAEIVRGLLAAVEANENISLYESLMAIDLVTTGWLRLPGESRCVGGYFLDRNSNEILSVQATHTVLASGGAGKVYLYTTNPDVATGDGIAMAWRAGLPIKNMEFVQFHPTCLYHPDAKSFLISEALRGEGGVLINSAGESFVEKHDARGSLASRDIVARAIDHELKSRGDVCVYLDVTHKDSEFLKTRFPNIHAKCLSLGIDMCTEPIPVVPAAHYCCGGVAATVAGETAMKGLHVIGEAACTGLHGANRLASNSLLEGAVGAVALAKRLAETPYTQDHKNIVIPDWQINDAVPSDEAVVVEHNWDEVRRCMSDYVGIERSDKRLARAARRIRNLRGEIQEYFLDYLVTADVLELRNIAAVAELIIRSAQSRQESRGLHYTLDFPQLGEKRKATVIHDDPNKMRHLLNDTTYY